MRLKKTVSKLFTSMMEFKLTEEELAKLIQWKSQLPSMPEDVWGEEYEYQYAFQPTGLGVIKTVIRVSDGAKLDLTDYDLW